jgi:hypothetical protein
MLVYAFQRSKLSGSLEPGSGGMVRAFPIEVHGSDGFVIMGKLINRPFAAAVIDKICSNID